MRKHKNKQNYDKFFEYIFFDSRRIIDFLANKLALMTTREELKIDSAKDEWKKLISKGWRRTKPVWENF